MMCGESSALYQCHGGKEAICSNSDFRTETKRKNRFSLSVGQENDPWCGSIPIVLPVNHNGKQYNDLSSPGVYSFFVMNCALLFDRHGLAWRIPALSATY